MMKNPWVYILVGAVILTGCALFETKGPDDVETLLADGIESFNAGKYRKALESFENIKDWYPFSKYAIVAELKIADCHYHLKEYEEAIFAYEEFMELHPRNDAIPYVLYQVGRCHFDQMNTIDRDQTATQEALKTFTQLKKQHPQSEYADKATEHINRCLKNLSEHDFYIGYFYYKSKHYRAALQRFQYVLTQYPDVGVHQKALRYIAKCEAKLAMMPGTEPTE